jgi:predicted RNA-binding Zn-ribbon protein involved in translation (DUF1610 family)
MSRHRALASVGEYDSHEALMADVAILRKAGIEPVASGLMDPDGRWRLEVDSFLVTPALMALGRDGYPELTTTDYACPRCGSPRSKAVPPYSMIAGFIVVAVLPWLFATQRWLWGGAVALGWMVGSRLLRARIMDWRCLNCGHAWNHDAERRRRDDARRAARE